MTRHAARRGELEAALVARGRRRRRRWRCRWRRPRQIVLVIVAVALSIGSWWWWWWRRRRRWKRGRHRELLRTNATATAATAVAVSATSRRCRGVVLLVLTGAPQTRVQRATVVAVRRRLRFALRRRRAVVVVVVIGRVRDGRSLRASSLVRVSFARGRRWWRWRWRAEKWGRRSFCARRMPRRWRGFVFNCSQLARSPRFGFPFVVAFFYSFFRFDFGRDDAQWWLCGSRSLLDCGQHALDELGDRSTTFLFSLDVYL